MERVRFAPSPTGYLHVGGARTALFNWLYARHYGGQFLLRIEDTDKARSTEESTKAIFDGLNWLGLNWDEEPVFQGANAQEHYKKALALVEAGKAYPCFCTKEQLDAQRAALGEGREREFRYDGHCLRLDPMVVAAQLTCGKPCVIRFRVPEGKTGWTDLVHGPQEIDNSTLDDFVIIRSDGSPIYNLAVVCDDIAMRVTTVLRGDDHVSNTPKQILLYEAFGAPVPKFGHLPMIHGPDGKKMSKRHGATAVGDYQHLGILPNAMVNFLALLGWSPGNDIEIMSRIDMILKFSTERLLKKASIFDMKKLMWMNGQQLAQMPAWEIRRLLTQGSFANALMTDALIDLFKVRARTVAELEQKAAPFLGSDLLSYEWDLVDFVSDETLLELMQEIKQLFASIPDPTVQALSEPFPLDQRLRELAERFRLKPKQVYAVVRFALLGTEDSPGMLEVLQMLGLKSCFTRLSHCYSELENRIQNQAERAFERTLNG